jgi:hypothetical protein
LKYFFSCPLTPTSIKEITKKNFYQGLCISSGLWIPKKEHFRDSSIRKKDNIIGLIAFTNWFPV